MTDKQTALSGLDATASTTTSRRRRAPATAAWEATANVNFTHVTAQDGACTASNNNVLFDVRPVNSGGQYLTTLDKQGARALYP